MSENLSIELGGIVVNPGDVLVVVVPERARPVAEQIVDALDAVGLTGRALVLTGDDIQLATVPDE